MRYALRGEGSSLPVETSLLAITRIVCAVRMKREYSEREVCVGPVIVSGEPKCLGLMSTYNRLHSQESVREVREQMAELERTGSWRHVSGHPTGEEAWVKNVCEEKLMESKDVERLMGQSLGVYRIEAMPIVAGSEHVCYNAYKLFFDWMRRNFHEAEIQKPNVIRRFFSRVIDPAADIPWMLSESSRSKVLTMALKGGRQSFSKTRLAQIIAFSSHLQHKKSAAPPSESLDPKPDHQAESIESALQNLPAQFTVMNVNKRAGYNQTRTRQRSTLKRPQKGSSALPPVAPKRSCIQQTAGASQSAGPSHGPVQPGMSQPGFFGDIPPGLAVTALQFPLVWSALQNMHNASVVLESTLRNILLQAAATQGQSAEAAGSKHSESEAPSMSSAEEAKSDSSHYSQRVGDKHSGKPTSLDRLAEMLRKEESSSDETRSGSSCSSSESDPALQSSSGEEADDDC